MGKWAETNYENELVLKIRSIFDEINENIDEEDRYSFEEFIEKLDSKNKLIVNCFEHLVKETHKYGDRSNGTSNRYIVNRGYNSRTSPYPAVLRHHHPVILQFNSQQQNIQPSTNDINQIQILNQQIQQHISQISQDQQQQQQQLQQIQILSPNQNTINTNNTLPFSPISTSSPLLLPSTIQFRLSNLVNSPTLNDSSSGGSSVNNNEQDESHISNSSTTINNNNPQSPRTISPVSATVSINFSNPNNISSSHNPPNQISNTTSTPPTASPPPPPPHNHPTSRVNRFLFTNLGGITHSTTSPPLQSSSTQRF